MDRFRTTWRAIQCWLRAGLGKAEDPETILAQAGKELERALSKSKARAYVAIGYRNRLQRMLEEQQNRASRLEADARKAHRLGKEELARQSLGEKDDFDASIARLRVELEQAEQAADAWKKVIGTAESQVRERAAERLARVTDWKKAEIQQQINEAFADSVDCLMSKQVRRMEAKAKARARELDPTSLQKRRPPRGCA